ncbi:MAG: BLUF domain-containing protein [Parasphingorhabdus sp.]|nr:BLUF domain-containing protein [Parasphingorhabdus sp.]
MLSIIYVSVADPALDEAEIEAIVAHSGANNSVRGLTGILLYNGFNFLQCLEGDDAAVNACFERIAVDPRHSGVTIVSRKPLAAREFSVWSMRFGRISGVQDFDDPSFLSLSAASEDTKQIISNFLQIAAAKKPRS